MTSISKLTPAFEFRTVLTLQLVGSKDQQVVVLLIIVTHHFWTLRQGLSDMAGPHEKVCMSTTEALVHCLRVDLQLIADHHIP